MKTGKAGKSEERTVVSRVIGYVHVKSLASAVLIQLCICRISLGAPGQLSSQLCRVKREEVKGLADKDLPVKTRSLHK